MTARRRSMTDAQAAVMRELRAGGVLAIRYRTPIDSWLTRPADQASSRVQVQTTHALIRKGWVTPLDKGSAEVRYVISALGIEAADREFGTTR